MEKQEITSKPLTIENMVKSLQKQNMSLDYLVNQYSSDNHFCLNDWNRIIEDLINEYWINYEIIPIHKEKSDNETFNSTVRVNEKFKGFR